MIIIEKSVFSQMSNKSNAVLLDVQKQRNDLLEGLLEKAKADVSNRMKDAAWHKALLVNLISQGLKELFEEKVEVIVCLFESPSLYTSHLFPVIFSSLSSLRYLVPSRGC